MRKTKFWFCLHFYFCQAIHEICFLEREIVGGRDSGRGDQYGWVNTRISIDFISLPRTLIFFSSMFKILCWWTNILQYQRHLRTQKDEEHRCLDNKQTANPILTRIPDTISVSEVPTWWIWQQRKIRSKNFH